MIRSNYHERQFSYRYEVPARVLAEDFNYQDEDEVTDGFFRYRGIWYHTDQFMYTPMEDQRGFEWHGSAADSFFSGVVISLSSDGETYRVGTWLSD